MAMSTEEIKKQLEEAIQEKTCDQSTDHFNEVSQSGELGLAEDIKPPSNLHSYGEYNCVVLRKKESFFKYYKVIK